MERFKRATGMGKRALGMLAVVALIVGNLGFNSVAAASDDFSTDGDAEVEIMEAVFIEDPDLPGGIVPYTMLTDCVITASKCSEGMAIDISTGVVGTASVIGIKDVKVKKKTWYGGWETVAVSDGKESYNRTTMGISLIYKGAEEGATYKITCVHYADVNGYIEHTNDGSEFVYNF